MCVLLVGGLDRMKGEYIETGSKLGHEVKVFTQRPARFEKLIGEPDGIVLFTGTVSHNMVKVATKIAKNRNIPVIRCHNSSAAALARQLKVLEESQTVKN